MNTTLIANMMKNGEYDGLTVNTMKILSKLTTQQRTVNTVVVKFRTRKKLNTP